MELIHNIFLLLLTLKWTTLARPQENLPATTTCVGNDVFYNNTCMPLLYEGSCGGPRDWLIRDDNGTLKCEPIPCYNVTMNRQRVLFNGTCVRVRSADYCPVGMEVVALDNGQGECDCKRNLVFWTNTSHTTSHEGGCYRPFERGPCSEHQVLYMPPVQQGGSAECRDNPCDEDQIPIEELPNGQLTYSVTGECQQLGSSCGPDDQRSELSIDYDHMTVKCARVSKGGFKKTIKRITGRQPHLNRHPCRYGSRRRSAGECQSAIAALVGG